MKKMSKDIKKILTVLVFSFCISTCYANLLSLTEEGDHISNKNDTDSNVYEKEATELYEKYKEKFSLIDAKAESIIEYQKMFKEKIINREGKYTFYESVEDDTKRILDMIELLRYYQDITFAIKHLKYVFMNLQSVVEDYFDKKEWNELIKSIEIYSPVFDHNLKELDKFLEVLTVINSTHSIDSWLDYVRKNHPIQS